jgi:hypothetical protein
VKLAAAALLGIAITLQVGRDRAHPRMAAADEAVLYIRSPEAIRRLALGFDSLAADLYWIRTIQYYGRQRLSRAPGERDYSLLYPLLDLTTSLDPWFDIAYRFGAIFLSERQPGGPGRPDMAETLLRKGIAAQPDEWAFFHDIAFVHYWVNGDPQTAAEWFQRGAERPGAPNWLAPVAAAMLAQTGTRDAARQLWQRVAAAEEEWLRRRAVQALAQLDALDQIEGLERVIARAPGPPYTWVSLVRAGLLPGIPVDPGRTPYELDPQTGRVTVSQKSPLFPMPRGMSR